MKTKSPHASLLALALTLGFLGEGALFGAAAEKTATARTQLQKMYADHLASEGFKPELDNEGDVSFKREGKTYFIQINEKDPTYFRIVLPNFWKIDDDAERLKVLIATDWSNGRTKGCKVFSIRDHVWASVDTFLPNTADFKAVMMRCLSSIDAGVQNFIQKMGEKSE